MVLEAMARIFHDPAVTLPGSYAQSVPVGFDGGALWYDSRVWEPAGPREYADPHEEDAKYGSAEPYLEAIQQKFLALQHEFRERSRLNLMVPYSRSGRLLRGKSLHLLQHWQLEL